MELRSKDLHLNQTVPQDFQEVGSRSSSPSEQVAISKYRLNIVISASRTKASALGGFNSIIASM
jgi:hypothetical protein